MSGNAASNSNGGGLGSSLPPEPVRYTSKAMAAPSVDCSQVSEDHFASTRFRWVIRDFPKLMLAVTSEKKKERGLQSDEFTDPDGKFKFCVVVAWHAAEDSKHHDYLGIFMRNVGTSTCRARLSILSTQLCMDSFKVMKGDGGTWGFQRALFKKDVEEGKSALLSKNGTLTITVDVEVLAQKKASSPPQARKRKATEDVETLGQRLWKIRTESQHDVTIKVRDSGRRCLPAHKLVLTASSDVMAAMFAHDTLEKKTNVITIAGIPQQTVEDMLEFLYLSTLNFDARTLGNIIDLLGAAEKYNMASLKTACEIALGNKVTVRNVGELCQVVEKYRTDLLEDSLAGFISENLKKMAKSPSWSNIPGDIVKKATALAMN